MVDWAEGQRRKFNFVFLVMLEWSAVVHANVISTSAMFSTTTKSCGFAHLIKGFRGLFVRVHMLIHTHTCKLWYHNKVLLASLGGGGG